METLAEVRARLECALEETQQTLRQLADYRLASIERGQEDAWQELHRRTTETLASIEQALATCYFFYPFISSTCCT